MLPGYNTDGVGLFSEASLNSCGVYGGATSLNSDLKGAASYYLKGQLSPAHNARKSLRAVADQFGVKKTNLERQIAAWRARLARGDPGFVTWFADLEHGPEINAAVALVGLTKGDKVCTAHT
jgi:hypothetical protein